MNTHTHTRISAATVVRTSQGVVVEPLEGRRLLSASLAGAVGGTAGLEDGALVVHGTKNADVIEVAMNYADPSGAPRVDVNLNGAVIGSFLLADVTQGVTVHAGKGDDSVRFDESSGLVPLSLKAHGGQGNDTLVGGSFDDELYGGVGDDTLYGNDGNDALYGEQGWDMLAGGFGDDFLDAGNGVDTLYGEAGDDALLGGNGRDSADGGDGADSLDGGCGRDALTGGLDADTFASADRPNEVLDLSDGDTHDFVKPAKRGNDRNDDDSDDLVGGLKSHMKHA